MFGSANSPILGKASVTTAPPGKRQRVRLTAEKRKRKRKRKKRKRKLKPREFSSHSFPHPLLMTQLLTFIEYVFEGYSLFLQEECDLGSANTSDFFIMPQSDQHSSLWFEARGKKSLSCIHNTPNSNLIIEGTSAVNVIVKEIRHSECWHCPFLLSTRLYRDHIKMSS
jgi:hypothetical protein